MKTCHLGISSQKINQHNAYGIYLSKKYIYIYIYICIHILYIYIYNIRMHVSYLSKGKSIQYMFINTVSLTISC